MKRHIYVITIALLSVAGIEAMKVQTPLQDTSKPNPVVSNNPAKQLGASPRRSPYYTGWRSGRRRATWHDRYGYKHFRQNGRKGTRTTSRTQQTQTSATK